MITYGDFPCLTIEKSFRGYYAYSDAEHDFAPDSEFPHNVYGHGDTPEAAVADYWSKRSD